MKKTILTICTMLMLGMAPVIAGAQEAYQAEVDRIVCANPANATQKAICENEELHRMDAEMKRVLDQLMTRIPEKDERARADLIYSQQRFARVRRLCQGNVSCLKRIHASRLETLRAALAAR